MAQFYLIADVAPYEFMKLLLLNANPLATAGLGRVIGCVHFDQAIWDPALRVYMRALIDRETGPTLPAVPGIDLKACEAKLVDCFGNAAIKGAVDSVSADAPANLLIEPIRDRLVAPRISTCWRSRWRRGCGARSPWTLPQITQLAGILGDDQSFISSGES